MASKNDIIIDDNKSQNFFTENMNKEKKIHWTEENETILVEWCDIAQCYKWLYYRAHIKFSIMHAWFTIPTITFSTISGTASFAQASIPVDYQNYVTMGIGSINIIIGVITTIQQYLKISELNESHRVSSISWDKFSRNIRIELAKIPEERSDAGSFIKVCRNEFDRLMETSPNLPEYIIKEFINKFKGKTEEEQENFKILKKPDICDTIVSVNKTRHKWYLEEKKNIHNDSIDTNDIETNDKSFTYQNIFDNNEIVKNISNIMSKKYKDIKKKVVSEKTHSSLENNLRPFKENIENVIIIDENNDKDKDKEQILIIEKYIEKFTNLYDRKPLKEEIIDNMKDEIDENILKIFLNKCDFFDYSV
jgi:hypothetical protein